MQVSDKFFESATEFVNQSIQLFDSFPLKVLTLDRSLLSFSSSLGIIYLIVKRFPQKLHLIVC